MTKSGRAATLVAATVLAAALGGCGGGGDGSASSSSGSSGGSPSCSGWAHGEKITEKLSVAGCSGSGVTTNAGTACTDANGKTQELVAVGPVYGVVGQPAKYLGAGEDATKSPEWTKLQQDCPSG